MIFKAQEGNWKKILRFFTPRKKNWVTGLNISKLEGKGHGILYIIAVLGTALGDYPSLLMDSGTKNYIVAHFCSPKGPV